MKDFLSSLFLFLLLAAIILGVGYLIVIPYDHYMVGGVMYDMSKWRCSSEATAEGEMGIWVSCSKIDGSESFRNLVGTFSVVDSRFDK